MIRTGSARWLCLALFASPVSAQLNCNVGVEFYPGGPLRACVLNGNHRLLTARGVPVTCADGRTLEQHPDGSLARCTLREAVRLDSQDCAAGSEPVFAADGALLHCKAGAAG